MFCPSCALQFDSEQRYCRSCGFDLKPIHHAIAGGADDEGDEPVSRVRYWGARITRLAGVLLMFKGIFVAIIGSMIVHQEIIVAAGALISILGMFLVVLPSVLAGSVGASARRRSTAKQARQTAQLEPPAPFASVVEHTTRSLEVEPAHAPRRTPSGEMGV